MFGRDLLIVPVVTENNNKTIALPPGRWTDLWNGRTITGPTNFTMYVPLDTIPVYLKPGAIVPVYLNRELRFGQSMSGGRVKALIVTPPNANEEAGFEYDAAPISRKTARRTYNTTVALRPEANGFAMTLNHFGSDYLLVYGIGDATSVSVDGVNLPKAPETRLASMRPGWQADSVLNRMIIHLPPNQSKMEIELAF
jgi:Glycosyl hydrolase family 31 C-terminal domain